MTEARKKVLMIDDDAQLASLLARFVAKYGYELAHAGNAEDGFLKLESLKPVAILLDVDLPGMSGLQMCQKLREKSAIPIVMISALGEATDRIVGLQLGADSYLPKPFEPRELVAHLDAVLRRAMPSPLPSAATEVVRLGGLEVDKSRRSVAVDGKPVEISSAEYELLLVFLSRPGHVFNRDELLDQLRGIEWDAYNRSVDVIVSRLRRKLGDSPKQPRFLKTVWGAGYVLLPQEEQRKAG